MHRSARLLPSHRTMHAYLSRLTIRASPCRNAAILKIEPFSCSRHSKSESHGQTKPMSRSRNISHTLLLAFAVLAATGCNDGEQTASAQKSHVPESPIEVRFDGPAEPDVSPDLVRGEMLVDIDAIKKRIDSIEDPDTRRLFLTETMESLYEKHPRLAADLALSLFDEGEMTETLVTLIAKWVSVNSADALDYLYALPDTLARTAALTEAGRTMAVTDPIAAMDIAQDLPEGDGRNHCAGQILQTWARRDGTAAAEWLLAHPAYRDAPHLTAELAGAWARVAPEQAAEFVSSRLATAGQREAAYSVVTIWAEQDAKGAANWALKFPDEGLRRPMLQIAMSCWTAQGGPGSEAWLASLNPQDAATMHELMRR